MGVGERVREKLRWGAVDMWRGGVERARWGAVETRGGGEVKWG